MRIREPFFPTTTHKDVRSYPCRSMESAIKLAERFIAGVIKPRAVTADVTSASFGVIRVFRG